MKPTILSLALAFFSAGCLTPSTPKASISEYFQGEGAGFAVNMNERSMSYSFSLSCRKHLPEGSMIVVLFENPNGGEPIGTDFIPDPEERQINCKSIPLKGFKKGRIYTITIALCDVADKTKIWSIHTERVLCSIDPMSLGL